MSKSFTEQYLPYRLTSLKIRGSEMFFINLSWWSVCYKFSSSYTFPWRYNISMVFLTVTNIFQNETYCLNTCFIPSSPTLRKSSFQF